MYTYFQSYTKNELNQYFNTYYHLPKMDKLRNFIQWIEFESKHKQAILHFIDVLENNESGFVYGMLSNAWDKYLDEIFAEL
jgi:hypothetical protein